MTDQHHFSTEKAVFFGILGLVSLFVFTDIIPLLRPLAQPYLAFFPLAWCAARFGAQTTKMAIIAIAAVAVLGSAAGAGAFAGDILALLLFLAATGAFLLFAVLLERTPARPNAAYAYISGLLAAPMGAPILLPGEQKAMPEPKLIAPPTPAKPKHSVLVVDDNHKTAISLAALLNHSGHVAQIALDGAQALAALADFRPNIVFLDIGLPKGSTGEAAALIRRYLDPAPAFIALTQSPEEGRAALEKGFDAYLTKPISIAELEEALSHAA